MIKFDSVFRPIHKFIGLAMSWKNIGLDVPSRPIFSSTHGLTNKSVYGLIESNFITKSDVTWLSKCDVAAASGCFLFVVVKWCILKTFSVR